MSDRPQRFSRPSFGTPGAEDPAADPEDSTVLRRNLRDSGEPARPQGTAPSSYGEPRLSRRQSSGPRATDESVWARGPAAQRSASGREPARPPVPPATPGSSSTGRGAYAPVAPPGPPATAPTWRATSAPGSASAPASASAPRSASAPASASAPPSAPAPAATLPPDQPVPGSAADELLDRYPEHPPARGGRSHRLRVDGETLDVPLPGRKLSDARRGAVTARALAVTALVLGLGGLAVTGGFLTVLATRNSTATPPSPSPETWNTAAGQAFGAQYLKACLARPRGDDRAEQARVDQLRAMNSGGFDEACRAAPTDTRPRTVTAATFNGQVAAVPSVPNGRYLGFTVDMDRATTSYVVPVYLDDPSRGLGPAVVGRIGVSPAGGYGVPQGAGAQRPVDPDLAASLRAEFLPQFLAAWAGSTASLEQFLAPQHTEAAATGLSGAVKDVQVTDTVAHPRKEVRPGQRVAYADGDVVDVEVATTGTLVAGGQPQPSSYRLVLERSNGKWFVQDAQGGAADVPVGVPSASKSARPPRTPR